MNTVVLALGNELLADEGVGIHAARQLRNIPLPQQVKIVLAGTAILEVITDIEHAENIIILDAMKGGEAPGTVYRAPFEDCSSSPCIASMHGFDIFRAMALAEKKILPTVLILGVEPAQINWSMELSEVVKKSLPHLIDATLIELEGFNIYLHLTMT